MKQKLMIDLDKIEERIKEKEMLFDTAVTKAMKFTLTGVLSELLTIKSLGTVVDADESCVGQILAIIKQFGFNAEVEQRIRNEYTIFQKSKTEKK